MNLYEVLGVPSKATAAQIRRAYQRQARALHPDLNPGDPVAAERFRQVSEAFAVLSDVQRRTEYDRGGTAPARCAPVAEVQFQGFDFSGEARTTRVGIRELFDHVLGAGQAPEPPQRGEDLEQTAQVTFAEAFRGTERRLQLVRHAFCADCEGAGAVPFGPLPCPRCHGAGQVRASRGHMVFARRCPDCNAEGVIRQRPCPRCRGEGRVVAGEVLDVRIPAGVAAGARVRVPACGNAGIRGGPPGDFVLTVQVEPHPLYRRENDDLFCTVPVTMVEAALGGHIEVPTPDGAVNIEIPSGTQHGQRFRLRKRGFPRLSGGRGDLYVEVRLFVPRVVDEASRALLRELAARHPENPRHDVAAAEQAPLAAPRGNKS